jgi:hypothetical protein
MTSPDQVSASQDQSATAGAIDRGTVDGRSLHGNDQSLISAHSTALRPPAHRYRRGSCGRCQSNINVVSGIRTRWRVVTQQDQARKSFILGAILRGWRFGFRSLSPIHANVGRIKPRLEFRPLPLPRPLLPVRTGYDNIPRTPRRDVAIPVGRPAQRCHRYAIRLSSRIAARSTVGGR